VLLCACNSSRHELYRLTPGCLGRRPAPVRREILSRKALEVVHAYQRRLSRRESPIVLCATSSVASDLNTVSDELGKSIAEIDSALKKLNLGISVWVDLNRWNTISIIPTKHRLREGQWQVGNRLRSGSGNLNWPDQEAVEQWLFSDAPRTLRLSAIEKLPEMLKSLSGEAARTTEKIRNSLAEAQAVAAAVKGAAEVSDQVGKLRNAVLQALKYGNQCILASMLELGEWGMDGNEVVIKVSESQTVVDMSLSADAKRLAIASASGILGRAVKLKIVPSVKGVSTVDVERASIAAVPARRLRSRNNGRHFCFLRLAQQSGVARYRRVVGDWSACVLRAPHEGGRSSGGLAWANRFQA